MGGAWSASILHARCAGHARSSRSTSNTTKAITSAPRALGLRAAVDVARTDRAGTGSTTCGRCRSGSAGRVGSSSSSSETCGGRGRSASRCGKLQMRRAAWGAPPSPLASSNTDDCEWGLVVAVNCMCGELHRKRALRRAATAASCMERSLRVCFIRRTRTTRSKSWSPV